MRKGEMLRPFRIIEAVEGRRFTFAERWIFADLICTYEIEPDPVGTRLSCLARISGPLAAFYRLFLRRRWSAQLAAAARGMARLAAKSA